MAATSDFSMHSSISNVLNLMPMDGYIHPNLLPALMADWAFGASYQRFVVQYGNEGVDLFMVSKEDIAQELKNA